MSAPVVRSPTLNGTIITELAERVQAAGIVARAGDEHRVGDVAVELGDAVADHGGHPVVGIEVGRVARVEVASELLAGGVDVGQRDALCAPVNKPRSLSS